MKRSVILAVAGAIALAGSGARGAELLVNGSFETGDLTGWTASDTGVFRVWAGLPSSLDSILANTITGAEDGSYYLLDGTNGEQANYSQTFSDVAGATYSVSLWYASDGGSFLHDNFNFSVQFLAIDDTILAGNEPTIAADWQQFTTSFIGTGFDTLTLGSENDPFANFFDNVSVTGPGVTTLTGPGVPEPATWALMIGGFGLVKRLWRPVARRFAVRAPRLMDTPVFGSAALSCPLSPHTDTESPV